MTLKKRYKPHIEEPELVEFWQAADIYAFEAASSRQVYAIDTPPPTVSGHLHLGHTYSYSHTDFIARYHRMSGQNVFYPMGFDDNGLPTERLVEKQYGLTAQQIGRKAFIEKCLEVSREIEKDYTKTWQRLGLSIDWQHTYQTINEQSRRIAQFSFLDLYKRGFLERKEAPAIWCPECQTSLAQADLIDIERNTEFVTIPFQIEGHDHKLEIATTRPELLPACVAIFVHPEDIRFKHLAGSHAIVPLFGQRVPILTDPDADPEKGTGAVMCCTFGDQADVAWWYRHQLPLLEAIDRQGRMTPLAGEFSGSSITAARKQIKAELEGKNLLLAHLPTSQSVRAHERCDTPVEYIVSLQWFVRVMAHKQDLLKAGMQIGWHPAHMAARYQSWVENLSWDWNISRQRYFGVPFPVWYCGSCGEIILADANQLPVDPLETQPEKPCPACGAAAFSPEEDIMDTWATSSLSPQIAGRWLQNPDLYRQVVPMQLRPQAHEIIRTWAFYTIVKSWFHFQQLPWKDVIISGWGIAGEGQGKISKSRGGGPLPPLDMMERYSADAVRYWAASTGPGKDAIISEEKIQLGEKFTTKLWNVARFAERFLANYDPRTTAPPAQMTPADRWILARTQTLILQTTRYFNEFEYAAAKSELETFFWRDLADNYLEMAKQRLYLANEQGGNSAVFCLYTVLLTTIKLWAPLLPFITEKIYLDLFRHTHAEESIHRSAWPVIDPLFQDQDAERFGETLIQIATIVRRYKSEANLSLGTPIRRLQLATGAPGLAGELEQASADLSSITRADQIEVGPNADPVLTRLFYDQDLTISIQEPGKPSEIS
ncbi:MAG: valine--tRNA ligase [Anaerolineales bacterium]|jgi:valyl-tRNA synthetase